MTAIGLSVGEIEDMAENAADRRARGVQDAKRLTVNERHDSGPALVDRAERAVCDGIAAAFGSDRKRRGSAHEARKRRHSVRISDWGEKASHHGSPGECILRLGVLMVNKK